MMSPDPCPQARSFSGTVTPDVSEQRQALIRSLSRVFGLRCLPPDCHADANFLDDLAPLFQERNVDAETALEKHERPWANVYLVKHGVVRLFRESFAGKIAIHHFFEEGDLIWPVFGRSRTVRNTLCLTTTTPCTLWVADFKAFRSIVSAQDEGRWARFALLLTEELAETATMREFHRATMSARERYQVLRNDYPELLHRVPDFQLAAWLGVVPATFSRLKHLKSELD
jgi:CRP-like cAMP-binding protein